MNKNETRRLGVMIVIAQSWRAASRWTALGVVMGVALLVVFKYLDFLGQSFAALFAALGLRCTWATLHIVVPVGVSFFTFKLISYVIELHRQRIAPVSEITERRVSDHV